MKACSGKKAVKKLKSPRGMQLTSCTEWYWYWNNTNTNFHTPFQQNAFYSSWHSSFCKTFSINYRACLIAFLFAAIINLIIIDIIIANFFNNINNNINSIIAFTQLIKRYGIDQMLIPPKKYFGILQPEYVEKRRLGLETYIQTLLLKFEDSLPQEILDFLESDKFVSMSVKECTTLHCFHCLYA